MLSVGAELWLKGHEITDMMRTVAHVEECWQKQRHKVPREAHHGHMGYHS